MSGHSRITKHELIRLARALGDVSEELEEETIATIFERCIEHAEQLGAPATSYPTEPDGSDGHPVVRDWARRVIDGAVEHVLSCRMGDNEAERFAAGWVDSAVRRHAAIDPALCTHTLRQGRCIRCALRPPAGDGPSVDEMIDLMHRVPLRPLALTEDRTAEQLKADGDAPMMARCKGCGRLLEESDYPDCPTCGAQFSLDDFEPDEVPEYDGPAPEPRDEDGAPLDMTPKAIELATDADWGQGYSGPTPQPLALPRGVPVPAAYGVELAPLGKPLQLATDDVLLDAITFGDEIPSIGVMPIENPTDEPITLRCDRGGRQVTINPGCVQNVTVARGERWAVVPADRRENAEQWAKTRGSKGGSTRA